MMKRWQLLLTIFSVLGPGVAGPIPEGPPDSGYVQLSGLDFINNSRLIFTGKVVRQESYWDPSGRLIMTRYVLRVLEPLKGESGSYVEIVEYGGTVGEETMSVAHAASYIHDQEYAVFSYRDLLGNQRTLGGSMGQFQILGDRAGGRYLRLYPSHPLRALLGLPSSLLQVERFFDQLRHAQAGATR